MRAVKTTANSGIIKDVDLNTRVVKGVFSAFDNRDADNDIILKGSYAKTIKEMGPASSKPRIKHLLDHNPFQAIGVLKELWEDSDGLNYVSVIGTHTKGEDALRMHRDGIITEHSVMIEVIKSQFSKADKANIIQEVKMWEGSSLQAWGSNPNTPTKSKLLEDIKENPWKVFERYRKLMKSIRDSDLSDEALDSLQIEANNIEIELTHLLKAQEPVGHPITFDKLVFEPSELNKFFTLNIY